MNSSPKMIIHISFLYKKNLEHCPSIKKKERRHEEDEFNETTSVITLGNGFDWDMVKDAYSLPEARLVFSMLASPRAVH